MPRKVSEVLVQTRVPRDVADWVSAEAQREGESVAGWLRRLLFRLARPTPTLFCAWLQRATHRAGTPQPGIRLRMLRELSAAERIVEFWNMEHPPRRLSFHEMSSLPMYSASSSWRVVIDGGARRWAIVAIMRSGDNVEVTLSLEEANPPATSR